MNPILLRRRRTDRLFWMMVAVSLVLHLGFVGAWIVASQLALSAPVNLPENVIKTKLVKLGKKRDRDLLPRKLAQPKQPKSKKAKELVDKTEEAKVTKDPAAAPRSASDILNDFEDKEAEKPDLSQLINNTVGEQTDEGREDGSEIGTELNGRMKASYNDKIIAAVRAKFNVPQTLSDEERVRLKATVYVRISASGEVTDASISKPSGSSAFDNAVLAAAKKASLPPPPATLKDFYANGVGFGLCPLRCGS